MRQLKYRVYDKIEKCYSDKAFSIDQIGICYVQDEDCYWEEIDEERYVVERYTGLEDKNGKDICEGDIVRCYSRRKLLGDYQVVWNEDCGGFECESLKPLVDGGGRMLKDVRVFCEIAIQFRIIGNIHEYSELVKEKK